MKVSVIMPTYNHEAYIAEAIESVLSQQTNFIYELLIGEDDSSDGTRQIVKKYASQYPDVIRAFYNSRDNVIFINGKATGRWNFINLMHQAQGEHLAILEGDDYWLDTDKLQIQVDYLARNNGCSIVFHNAWRISEEVPVSRKLYCRKNLITNGSTLDLLITNYIPTCTVMYRKNIVDELPDWYTAVPMGDWPLHLINSQWGTADFLPEMKGVYRQHEGGLWHEARNDGRAARKYDLQLYKEINQYFDYCFESEIGHAIALKDAITCLKFVKQGKISTAYKYYSEYISAGAPLKPTSLHRFAKLAVSAVAHRQFGKKIGI